MKTKPLLDMNLLPPDYRGRPLFSWAGLALVLLALILAVILLPLLDAQTRAQEALTAQQARLEALADEEQALMVNEPAASDLRSRLQTDEQTLKALEEDYRAFRQEKMDWPLVLDNLFARLSPGMAFISFTQEGTELEARGTAPDSQAVVAYVRQLSQGGLFSNVKLNYREADGGVEFTLLLKPQGGFR